MSEKQKKKKILYGSKELEKRMEVEMSIVRRENLQVSDSQNYISKHLIPVSTKQHASNLQDEDAGASTIH